MEMRAPLSMSEPPLSMRWMYEMYETCHVGKCLRWYIWRCWPIFKHIRSTYPKPKHQKCKERHDLTQLDILNLFSCWLCCLVALPPLSFLQWCSNLSRSPSPTSWNLWRPRSIRNMWAFFNNAEQCLMLVNKFKLNETLSWMISGVQTLGILLVCVSMWISVFLSLLESRRVQTQIGQWKAS